MVVALFIVEHGTREVVKYILYGQGPVRLRSSVGKGQGREDLSTTDLYPFVPNEKSMGIVILRVQVSQVHDRVGKRPAGHVRTRNILLSVPPKVLEDSVQFNLDTLLSTCTDDSHNTISFVHYL